MTSEEIYKNLEEILSESLLISKRDIIENSDIELVFLLHMEQYFFHEDRPIASKPKLHDSYINIYRLAEVVESYGGIEQVKSSKKWKDVARLMGSLRSNVSTYKSLKHSYMRYIEPFVNHIHSGEILPCCDHFSKPIFMEINRTLLGRFANRPSVSEEPVNSPFKELATPKIDKPIKSNPRAVKDLSSSESESSHDSLYSFFSRSEAPTSSGEVSLDFEREIFQKNDKVKIKYGKIKKLYEAVILDVDLESKPRRYFVHYIGWNSTHDEWVGEYKVIQKIVETGLVQKKKRGRRPKPKNAVPPVVLPPKERTSAETRKSHRSTYNSLQDEVFNEVIANSLKEYQQHGPSNETSELSPRDRSHHIEVNVNQHESLNANNSSQTPNNDTSLTNRSTLEQENSNQRMVVETESSHSESVENSYPQSLIEEKAVINEYMNTVFELARHLDRKECRVLMSETMLVLKQLKEQYQKNFLFCRNNT